MNEFWWINLMDTNFNWIANHLIGAKSDPLDLKNC